jgi:uncharacterized membrane protein (UPF0127 family)
MYIIIVLIFQSPVEKFVMSDKQIASKIEYANTTLKLLIGLMFKWDVPQDYAIVYDMKYDQPVFVHTLFCYHCLDAMFLDRDKNVIQIMRCIKPWSFRIEPSKPARYFVETLAGEVKRHSIHVGDKVSI